MKLTQDEIIVRFLHDAGEWIPTHGLMMRTTAYGYIGSAGHVRARELARNECPDKLKNMVERAEGREIGMDARYAYFRYRSPKPTQLAF